MTQQWQVHHCALARVLNALCLDTIPRLQHMNIES